MEKLDAHILVDMIKNHVLPRAKSGWIETVTFEVDSYSIYDDKDYGRVISVEYSIRDSVSGDISGKLRFPLSEYKSRFRDRSLSKLGI